MKREIFVIVAVVVSLVSMVGCGAVRSTLEQTSDGKMVYSNMGIGQSGAGASTLANAKIADAEAYRIKKQADTLDKMMTGLQEGKVVTATSGKFIIGLINNDPSHGVYLYHPEIPGLKLTVGPGGGFQIFDVRDIPDEFVLYGPNGNIIQKIQPRYDYQFQEKISHKKRVGNILVDYLITINKY